MTPSSMKTSRPMTQSAPIAGAGPDLGPMPDAGAGPDADVGLEIRGRMDARGRIDHGSVGGSIWAPSADGWKGRSAPRVYRGRVRLRLRAVTDAGCGGDP